MLNNNNVNAGSKSYCCSRRNDKTISSDFTIYFLTMLFIIISAFNYAVKLVVYKKTLLYAPLVSQFIAPLIGFLLCLPICACFVLYRKCRKCDLQTTHIRGFADYTTTSWKTLTFVFIVLSGLSYYAEFIFSRYAIYLPEYLRSIALPSSLIVVAVAGSAYKRQQTQKMNQVSLYYNQNFMYYFFKSSIVFYVLLATCFVLLDASSDYHNDKINENRTIYRETAYECRYDNATELGSEAIVVDYALPLTVNGVSSGNGSILSFCLLFTFMVCIHSAMIALGHLFIKINTIKMPDISSFTLTLWTTLFSAGWIIVTIPFLALKQSFSYGPDYIKEGLTCILSSANEANVTHLFPNLPLVDHNVTFHSVFTPCDDWRARTSCTNVLGLAFIVSLLSFLQTWLGYALIELVDVEYLWFAALVAYVLKDLIFGLHGFYDNPTTITDNAASDVIIVIGLFIVVIAYHKDVKQMINKLKRPFNVNSSPQIDEVVMDLDDNYDNTTDYDNYRIRQDDDDNYLELTSHSNKSL